MISWELISISRVLLVEYNWGSRRQLRLLLILLGCCLTITRLVRFRYSVSDDGVGCLTITRLVWFRYIFLLFFWQNFLQAGMIVGGWDKYEGGKIYGVPLGGTLLELPFTIGGVWSELVGFLRTVSNSFLLISCFYAHALVYLYLISNSDNRMLLLFLLLV